MEIKKGKKPLKFGAACLPVEFLAEKYNFLFGLESVNLLIKDFADQIFVLGKLFPSL